MVQPLASVYMVLITSSALSREGTIQFLSTENKKGAERIPSREQEKPVTFCIVPFVTFKQNSKDINVSDWGEECFCTMFVTVLGPHLVRSEQNSDQTHELFNQQNQVLILALTLCRFAVGPWSPCL